MTESSIYTLASPYSFLLHSLPSISLLCVNTIQRDLNSNIVAGISLALVASPHLVPRHVLSSILPAIERRCQHPDWRVRRRALFAIVSLVIGFKSVARKKTGMESSNKSNGGNNSELTRNSETRDDVDDETEESGSYEEERRE